MESLKAWHVKCFDISDEPWHWDEVIVYASTRNKARSKGLKYFDGAEVEEYSGKRNAMNLP